MAESLETHIPFLQIFKSVIRNTPEGDWRDTHVLPKDRLVNYDPRIIMVPLGGYSTTGSTKRAKTVSTSSSVAKKAPATDPGLKAEKEEWGLGPSQGRTADELLDAIDRGNYDGGRTGRFWTLDPIDGTKGFLRGEQYAVCLALIVDARVELGVMGCPNLPVSASDPSGPRGCLFVAVRGQGAYQLPLDRPFSGPGTRLTIPPTTPETLNFLESVEKAHAKLSFNERVAQILGVTRPPTRMDSQAKYCSLARGDGGVYLRMPTGTGYKEKIWDHAPGSVLVEEAGGVITDGRGKPLDFGLGRTLGENYGVVAAGKDVHDKVIAAVMQAKAEEDAAAQVQQ
ncbi:3(2),5-bisphosphate nucleotidase HAL2 [Trametes cingulata]|nr:3(2),5-bisphosphate nucleotidase HAL2 [Trametes cingulata]